MRITKEFKLKGAFITCVLALVFMLFGVFITTGRSGDSINSSNNAEIMVTSGLSVEADETETVGVAGEIYASGSSGVDTNDGATSSTPVASMERILELLPDGGVVNVLSPIIIEEDLDFNPSAQITFLRTTEGLSATYKDGTASYGEMIKIAGADITVNFYKTTFDGNNIETIVGNIKYLMLLSGSSSTTVSFNDGCIIQNNRTRGVVATQGDINISTTDLTIQNCEGEYLGFVVDINIFRFGDYNIVFDGLKVINNVGYDVNERTSRMGLLIHIVAASGTTGNLEIKNCIFDSNSLTSESDDVSSLIYLSPNQNQYCLLENCKFLNNETSSSEFFCYGRQYEIEVKDCYIDNLRASGNYVWHIRDANSVTIDNMVMKNSSGFGAIGILFAVRQEMNITNSTFLNNEGHNGAYQFLNIIHEGQGTHINISNCKFEGNNFGEQLVLWNNEEGLNGTTTIENCYFQNVERDNSIIIVHDDLNSLTISDCNFIKCVTSEGVISSSHEISEFIMSGCKFENNITTGSGACLNVTTSNGDFEINDCVFLNNQATGNGGAIALSSMTATYSFTNCEFLKNISGGDGGAICYDWQVNSNNQFTFNYCYFKDNSAEGDGGALSFRISDTSTRYYGNDFYANNCEFENNTSGVSGGAIGADINLGPHLYLNNCYFHDNTAYGAGGACGGDILNYHIEGGVYERNVSSGNGGAIYGYYITANNAVFRSNSTNESGGAVYIGNCRADNITVENNTSLSDGGGIRAYSSIEISNSSICSNYSEGSGGGLQLSTREKSTFENCIIKDNYSARFGAAIYKVPNSTNTNGISMTNCDISYNESDGNGGIIHTNSYFNDEILFEDCKFIGNKASSGNLFYFPYEGDYTGGKFTFKDSLISNNIVGDHLLSNNGYPVEFSNVDIVGNYLSSSSQAMLYMSKADLTVSLGFSMTGGAISGNVTNGGGMVYVKASEQYPAEVSFDGVSIYGNTDQTGAVLQVGGYTSVSLTNCSVFSNVGAKGGAIGVKNNGNLVLGGGVEFGNNFADLGSGIYVEDGGVASLSNVVLHDMTGASGVFYTEYGGILNIVGGEVYNNTGENGSVFYYDGSGVISGVVAYNNTGTNGGVLYVGETGSVTLEDIDFYSNSATNGGAVYSNGAINFRSGEIRENTATNGGGVYVGSNGSFAMSYTERLEITGSDDTGYTTTRVGIYGVVDGNTADYGGGVYIAENGSATINGGHKNGQDEDENSTITGAGVNNNTTNYDGGGVYVSKNATLTILGGEVEGNEAPDNDDLHHGFGIYNGGSTIINGGSISHNNVKMTSGSTSKYISYGGIYCDENSILDVKNAIFYDNRGQGGPCVYTKSNSIVQIRESLFLRNFVYGGPYSEGHGIIRVIGGEVKIDNCSFIKNSSNYLQGGWRYLIEISPNDSVLEISNSYFGENTYFEAVINVLHDTGKEYTSCVRLYDNVFNLEGIGAKAVDVGNSRHCFSLKYLKEITIIGCQFISKESGDDLNLPRAGLRLDAEEINIEDCVFDGNKTGLLFESPSGSRNSVTNINNCEFKNVYYNGTEAHYGALAVINSQRSATINISNVSFENCYSNYMASALYLGGSVNINLSGDIIVQNNETTNSSFGAVFINNSNVVIREGTRLIVKDNVGGNVVFGSGIDRTVLEGNLDDESEVYVELSSTAAAGGLVVGGISSQYLMTNDILDKFYISDSNFGLRFSEAQNGLVLYDKSENGELSVVVSDKVVVQEVGESYSIEDGDIEVLFSGSAYQGEYSIEYSLTGLEGSWSDTSPSLRAKGEYTIYYKVSADILEEPIVDNVTIKIIGQRIYLKSVPTANLRYGEALSRAVFSGGLVEDEKGQAVAGVWSFSESTTVPSSVLTRYTATFTPYNQIYENSNVISVSVPVNISYGVVFYANGGFVTNEKDVNNTYIGINNLSQMVEYMSDNSSIIFTEAYTIIGDVSIVANKNIDFVRHSTFMTGPMIIVDVDSSLTLNGGSGELVFEGAGSLSGRNDFKGGVIDNRGEINLQTNVIFRAFSITCETAGDDIYSPIRNREDAVLRLSGAEIYGNILRSGLSNTGGIIYNEGTLYISGGRFYSNHMDAAKSTSTRQGVGGFIYNLGNVYMSGGEIFNNRAELGGAIYIAGGSVRLNGGRIYANQTTNGGGAIYVGIGGELVLGATDIYGNFATSGENGIENAGGDIVDISLNTVSGEMLAEIENKNYDMGLKFDESGENGDAKNGVGDGAVVGLMFVALVLGFVCVIVIRKRKRNF